MRYHRALPEAFKFCIVTLTAAGRLYTPGGLGANRSRRKFPHGCRVVGFSFNNHRIVLKPANKENLSPDVPQTLYLIHNRSHHIGVQVEVPKSSAEPFSLTYKNTIKANQWAALSVDHSTMVFGCSTRSEGSINCFRRVEICQYNNAKFASHNTGTYWVVNSGVQKTAVYGSIRSGILLRC